MANLVFSGAFNIVTDLAILIVPVIACWNLHLGVRKRIGLFAVLTIGAAYIPLSNNQPRRHLT